MTSHRLQLLIFVVVQSAFVLLDLFELWRMNGRPHARPFLATQRRLMLFLAVVWLGYFALQNLLLLAVPAPETTLAWFARVFALTSAPTPPWSWRTAIASVVFLVGTYFVAGLLDYALH